MSLEERIPTSHPLRKLRMLVDSALASMDDEFDAIYACVGRPPVPPQRLLKALLLQILFSIRSERLLVESLDYNLLYRRFGGLGIDDAIWDHSTFSQNRDRLFNEGLARILFERVKALAHWCKLTSSEHFSVDGTRIEACASHKSHVLMENRNGLVVDVDTTPANGTSAREAALRMIRRQCRRGATVGADKGYDTHDFVAGCRKAGVTPHVAAKRTGSALVGRTTHATPAARPRSKCASASRKSSAG